MDSQSLGDSRINAMTSHGDSDSERGASVCRLNRMVLCSKVLGELACVFFIN
jgi:hypothetical protein